MAERQPSGKGYKNLNGVRIPPTLGAYPHSTGNLPAFAQSLMSPSQTIAGPSLLAQNQQAQQAAAAAQYQANMPARQNSFSSTHSLTAAPRMGSLGLGQQPVLTPGKIAFQPPMPGAAPGSGISGFTSFIGSHPQSVTQFRFGADFPFGDEVSDPEVTDPIRSSPLSAPLPTRQPMPSSAASDMSASTVPVCGDDTLEIDAGAGAEGSVVSLGFSDLPPIGIENERDGDSSVGWQYLASTECAVPSELASEALQSRESSPSDLAAKALLPCESSLSALQPCESSPSNLACAALLPCESSPPDLACAALLPCESSPPDLAGAALLPCESSPSDLAGAALLPYESPPSNLESASIPPCEVAPSDEAGEAVPPRETSHTDLSQALASHEVSSDIVSGALPPSETASDVANQASPPLQDGAASDVATDTRPATEDSARQHFPPSEAVASHSDAGAGAFPLPADGASGTQPGHVEVCGSHSVDSREERAPIEGMAVDSGTPSKQCETSRPSGHPGEGSPVAGSPVASFRPLDESDANVSSVCSLPVLIPPDPDDSIIGDVGSAVVSASLVDADTAAQEHRKNEQETGEPVDLAGSQLTSGDYMSFGSPTSSDAHLFGAARQPCSGTDAHLFNSTYSYAYSLASDAYLPVQTRHPVYPAVPRSQLAPTAEDAPHSPTTPSLPSGLQLNPDSPSSQPPVAPFGYFHGHHVRHESYPSMHDRFLEHDDDEHSMVEGVGVRRFSHQRNTSTSSCPATDAPSHRRHSAPQASSQPAWLLEACENGFRFVAQNIDDTINVSQNKTALTFVFEKLGQDVVPMPKNDSWFTKVFQNFDEEETRTIYFDSFVEIVRQYYDHHARYRRKRAQQKLQQHASSLETTRAESSAGILSSDVAGQASTDAEVPASPAGAIVEENSTQGTSKRGSEEFGDGNVGSDGDECLVTPIFPASRCLLPDKGRQYVRSAVMAPPTGIPRLPESGCSVSVTGIPVKLPAALEYPAYEGRLKIFDDYDFFNQAGKGAFGKVIVVRHKRSKATRACKTIRVQNDMHKTLIHNEIECLQRLNHPNILKLYETYSEEPPAGEEEFTKNIYLIMEMCEGGDLLTRMLYMYDGRRKKTLTENTIAQMVQQMLSGIAYCHAQGIIHRDLKPDNILFVDRTEDSDLKIIDFGLASFKDKIMADAKEVKIKRPGMLGKLARALPGKQGKHIISHHVRRQVMQRAGTAHYMAPEMFKAEYDEKCDLFSIGIIVYQLLTGMHPFYEHRDDEEKVRQKICAETAVDFPRNLWNAISREAKETTWRLLIKNPLKRPSASEVLKDKWLRDYSKTIHFGRMEDISHSVFEGLRRYQGHNKLKKAVLQLLARELSEFQIQELRKKFLALDKTGTGFITREELMQGMKQSGLKMSDKELLDIVKSLGDDSNGAIIGYNQFVGALIERVRFTKSQLEEVFQKLDTDKSGFITPTKLQSALTSQNITLAEVQDIWREVDPCKNPSAGISFDEFCSLFNFPDSQQSSPKMAKI